MDRRELMGLVLLIAVVLGGIGFWYLRSLPRPVPIEGIRSGGPSAALPASTTPVAATAPVVVYVSGWVHSPGVYEFQTGDRVVDALDRAGGAKKGADLTALNLAALLVDGEQIVVGKLGAGRTPPSGTSTGSGNSGASGLVNINSATLEELETLPGIGPSLGQRIIDYRVEHGPFHSVDELLNVSGIGDKRLEDLRSQVTV